MYVDDNTNYFNEFKGSLKHPILRIELAGKLKHNAQTWERCLWTSERLIKLDKCLFYIMQRTFNKDGLPMLTNATYLPPITVTPGNTLTKLQIEQNNFDTTHNTLGNRMAPSLQMQKALEILTRKSKFYAYCILTSNLHQHDIWKAYFFIFVPRMRYLLCLSLHEK